MTIRNEFTAATEKIAVDTAAFNRRLLQFQRSVKKGQYQEQDVKRYIESHMPTEDFKPLTDFLENVSVNEAGVVNYLGANHFTYEDTLLGYYVPAEVGENLKQLLHHRRPIRTVFEENMQENELESSFAAYHQFLAFARARGLIVHRIKKHPLYPVEREFFDDQDSNLYELLKLWCQLQRAEIPSMVDGYLSIAEAAKDLQCRKEDILDYAASHPEETITENGQMLVMRSKIAALADEVGDLVSLLPMLSRVAKKERITVNCFREAFEREVKRKSLNWLRLGSDFPGKNSMEMYYCQRDEDNVVRELSELTAKTRLYPIQDLQQATDCSLAELRRLAEQGVIRGTQVNKNWLISWDERTRVMQLAEQYASVEDALSTMAAGNTYFDLGLVKVREDVKDYLERNEYFGLDIIPAEGVPKRAGRLGLLILKEEQTIFLEKCSLYVEGYGKTEFEKLKILYQYFEVNYPATIQKLREYVPKKQIQYSQHSLLEMAEWLLSRLDVELAEYGESRIEDELAQYSNELSYAAQSLLYDFLCKSGYTVRSYQFQKSTEKMDVSAYSEAAYATMVAAVVNHDVWKEQDLVVKAVTCQRYADAWLFLAMHVYAAWRTSDYLRLEAPPLPYDAETTLQKIANGTYMQSDKMRVATLFLEDINTKRNVPHKTERFCGITPLYLYCPEECKASFGLQLSIAAAHALLSGRHPFIKREVELRTFLDFFGDPMAEALGYRMFSTRKANKALLQSVQKMAERQGNTAVVTYSMASRMRSHKAGYGQLAETTALYLQAAPLGEYPVQRIVEMLFERGICSFAIDALLKNCYGELYCELPADTKNELISNIGLTPAKADELQRLVLRAEDEATELVQTLCTSKERSNQAMAAILSDDTTWGKDRKSHCLLVALGQACKQPMRQRCMGCPYEIRTKAMFVDLCKALYQQQAVLQNQEKSDMEREKAKWLMERTLWPMIVEIQCHLPSETAKSDSIMYAEIAKECYGKEQNGG